MADYAPVTVSWSQVRANEECRQKAFLLRTHRKSAAADIRNYFPGTVVDRVMRAWLDNDPQPGEMPDMVGDIMNAEELTALAEGDGVVRWRDQSDRKQLTLWCQELVRRLEPILYKLVIPYEYETAKRFRVPVQVPYLDGRPTSIYLAGEMDLLVRDEHGQFVVFDLKGTADNSYWRKTLGQLVFYDISTWAMFGAYCTSTGLIQPMCTEPVLTFTFTDQDYREMWARIHRYVSDLWAKDREPKTDSQGCAYCHVRHACSKYTPVNPGQNQRRLSLQGLRQVNGELEVQASLEQGL